MELCSLLISLHQLDTDLSSNTFFAQYFSQTDQSFGIRGAVFGVKEEYLQTHHFKLSDVMQILQYRSKLGGITLGQTSPRSP